jgi:DNA-binding GntR family transcriptional regulator
MPQANTEPEGLTALGDVQRRTAHEHVVERLRSAILGGALAPGTPLVLSDLAARMRVSRTPIREAIRDLATEGLVDFDSYRSAVVHVPTLAEAQEVYDLRLVLEPIAVRRAIDSLTDEDLARARELHERMLATGDVGAWVPLNRDFHATLLEPAGSPRLLSMIRSLRDAAAIHVALSLRAEVSQLADSNEEHARLLDAYARRDADAAADLTGKHLRSTLDIVQAYERAAAGGPR